MDKTFLETNNTVTIIDTAEVLVVGGGPAGTAAAIAAARTGAKTVLLERYGHLGGMASGGEVILIPALSTDKEIQIRGVMLEIMERLTALKNGVCGPDIKITGSTEPQDVGSWKPYFDMVRYNSVSYGGFVEPELLKIVLNEMMEENGVTVYLHSLACKAIVKAAKVEGVIFESKQGRNAVLADAVIDCTGDGDIFASAGVEFEVEFVGGCGGCGGIVHSVSRTSSMAVVYRLGGADFAKHAEYFTTNAAEWKAHEVKMNEIAGYEMKIFPTSRNDVVWVDNWLLGYDCLKIKDLTAVEFAVRRTLLKIIDYINSNNIPGLEDVWLYDTASQIGTRGSRRVKGEYRMTVEDMNGRTFDDTVAVIPAAVNPRLPNIPSNIPLRTLIAAGKDNLFVAGRCFSSDVTANCYLNLVPHCFAMGQAAGVAAAIAVQDKKHSRDVNIAKVQNELRKQDVFLP